jgi:hypothetical protein
MNRQEAVKFWDDYILAWIHGEAALETWFSAQDPLISSDLNRWMNSYRGSGRGALDLSCFPDPYVGDLGGSEREPQMISLGLNPGVGYAGLQGRGGLWTNRILTSSYSSCADRSVPGDPSGWLQHHKKESPYWRKLLNFGKRWHGESFTHKDLLSVELYPWHSNSLTAGLDCPGDIIQHYVLSPLAEFECKTVFAFGKSWEQVCLNAGMRVIDRYGIGYRQFPGVDCPGWSVVLFRPSASPALFVVSWQKGYAGPPGQERIPTLQAILNEFC